MKKGRNYYCYFCKFIFFLRIRAIALFVFIPAFWYGCSSEDYTSYIPEEQSVTSTSFAIPESRSGGNGHIDIFIFNDDRLKWIDSYQRIEWSGGKVNLASRRGDKIVVAIANSYKGYDYWKWTSSYEGLRKETALLSEENTEFPIMSGERHITAGSSEIYPLDMRKLMSQIYVRSLKTDFRGTKFAGEPLEDVKIYLTNVSASCPLSGAEKYNPESIINLGALDMDAIEDFKDIALIVQDIGKVDSKGLSRPVSLFCYPSDHETETAGSPFTRLVIEGCIRGNKYYYPITINRDDGHIGIERNCRYIYDITICRSGTSDPDIPVSIEDIMISGEIVPWTEKDNEDIRF